MRLHVEATITFPESVGPRASIFIDTGSDVCLIRRGIAPVAEMRPAQQPMRLTGANRGAIPGGQFEILANIRLLGEDLNTGNPIAITVPTTLMEADIEEDIILSLEWLGEHDFDVCARHHGLRGYLGSRELWLPGSENDLRAGDMLPQATVKAIPARPIQRALDLFCGRKSAARVLEKNGFRVTTLDVDPGRNPDICMDILKWECKSQFPPEYFDLIVACPPCTEYSLAMTARPRRLEEADTIVRKTLEIIAYFSPSRWWLETPRTGILARAELMRGYPYLDCDHCQFENLGYQKPTRFFGSKHLLELPPVLCDGVTCTGLVDSRPGDPPIGGHIGVQWVVIMDMSKRNWHITYPKSWCCMLVALQHKVKKHLANLSLVNPGPPRGTVSAGKRLENHVRRNIG